MLEINSHGWQNNILTITLIVKVVMTNILLWFMLYCVGSIRRATLGKSAQYKNSRTILKFSYLKLT